MSVPLDTLQLEASVGSVMLDQAIMGQIVYVIQAIMEIEINVRNVTLHVANVKVLKLINA